MSAGTDRTDLAKPDGAQWDADTVALIKRTVAKDASDDELRLFLYQAKRTGLDPLSRQIHFIKRWDSTQQREVGTIQAAIDGLRLIASRTGNYRPDDEAPRFVLDDKGGLVSAKVRVYFWHKPSMSWHGVEAEAFYAEYVQRKKDGSTNATWFRMPRLMLAKCAEALALRKSFPAELSGIYAHEEFGDIWNVEYKVGGGGDSSTLPTTQTPVGSPISSPAPETNSGRGWINPPGQPPADAPFKSDSLPAKRIAGTSGGPADPSSSAEGQSSVSASALPRHPATGAAPSSVPSENVVLWGILEKNRGECRVFLPQAVEAAQHLFKKSYNARLSLEQMKSLDRVFALYSGNEKVGDRTFETVIAAAEFVRMETQEAPLVLAQEKEDAKE